VRDVRNVSYKETKAAIWALIDAGWDVVPESKHYRAWCPCEDDSRSTQVSCTPQNDGNLARRLAKVRSRYPNRHELIR
jgi:hypothetical protein